MKFGIVFFKESDSTVYPVVHMAYALMSYDKLFFSSPGKSLFFCNFIGETVLSYCANEVLGGLKNNLCVLTHRANNITPSSSKYRGAVMRSFTTNRK